MSQALGQTGGPWRNWYHCMGNTYGTWLPGDERGWRSRHHRVHVEGDYKNPPRQDYSGLHVASRNSMKKNTVQLIDEHARQSAAQFLFEAFTEQYVDVRILSVCHQHFHVLVRFVPRVAIDHEGYVAQWNHTHPDTAQVGFDAQMKIVRLSICGRQIITDPARHYVGLAKKKSAARLVKAGCVPRGGTWAKRGKIVPITDKAHYLKVVEYIRAHREQGAVILEGEEE